MKVIKRGIYLSRLISRKENCLIKIITGIRRCGKSYLLNELFVNYLKESGVKEDYIIKLALDREENKKYHDSKLLNNIGDSFKKIIVVKDNIKLWRNENKFLIIGIQEFLLSKDSLDL